MFVVKIDITSITNMLSLRDQCYDVCACDIFMLIGKTHIHTYMYLPGGGPWRLCLTINYALKLPHEVLSLFQFCYS